MPGGRLIIIDFAPHNVEFLRDSFAHERLGFSDAQIRQWLLDAGLVLDRAERLARSGGQDGKLTVIVWSASRPAAGSSAAADRANSKVEA
jgi:ArsR family transcriptional regulator